MKSRAATHRPDALSLYLRGLRDYPPLSREEEVELAQTLRTEESMEAAQRLVQANLRAVVKIASRYQRSDVGLLELIQEGNLGLLQAVQRFDPDRGVRLVTYASWWIRAYIQRYLQNRGYLSGRSLDLDSSALADSSASPAPIRTWGAVREVSLDQPMSDDSRNSLSSLLADDSPNQEMQYLSREAATVRSQWVQDGMSGLDQQERQVIVFRYLHERPRTLKEIGEELGLSRQRIHQIEIKARRKLGEALRRRPAAAFA